MKAQPTLAYPTDTPVETKNQSPTYPYLFPLHDTIQHRVVFQQIRRRDTIRGLGVEIELNVEEVAKEAFCQGNTVQPKSHLA